MPRRYGDITGSFFESTASSLRTQASAPLGLNFGVFSLLFAY